jgi:uncharacterized protein
VRTFEGQSILISGAASGIGRALAIDFCNREKSRLILIDKDREKLQRLLNELHAPDNAVLTYPCDLSLRESVDAFFQSIAGVPIHHLIHCAGQAHLGTFAQTDIRDFEQVIQTNLLGSARLIKGALPSLQKAPNSSIVIFASMAGIMGAPGMSAYSASKFGMIGLSEALQLELRDKVHVCIVCPGFVRTGIAQNMLRGNDVGEARHKEQIALAQTVLFKQGSSPSTVSKKTILAMKKRKSFTLIGQDAYFLYFLRRFSRTFFRIFIKREYQKLVRKGVIQE